MAPTRSLGSWVKRGAFEELSRESCSCGAGNIAQRCHLEACVQNISQPVGGWTGLFPTMLV